jgi:hypothetical protein
MDMKLTCLFTAFQLDGYLLHRLVQAKLRLLSINCWQPPGGQ